MSGQWNISRRALLRTAAITAVTGTGTLRAAGPALAGPPPAPPAPLDPSARFELTAPGQELFGNRPLHDATVPQSLAFDNDNEHVYVVQLMAGGKQLPGEPAPVSGAVRSYQGDLCLTRLDLAGHELGHMYLKGFGHGVQIGAEPLGDSAFLWTEVNSVADDGTNGWGTRIARFRFTDGAVLTPDSPEVRRMQLIAGADRTTCGVDPAFGRLVMRYRLNGAFRYGLYDLADVRRNRFVPLADVAQPALSYSFQGYTSYGDRLYLLEGSSYGSGGSTPGIGNTYLTCVDWTTSVVLDRQLVTDAQSLPFREPEGLAIQLPDVTRPDLPRLAFAFASGVVGARTTSVWYKDLLV
ncbi:hypothetical protein ONA91_35005 [Micromonospora sp. DR5-3]|uniref:phage baseplate protein n=1 Tax=unclassified Micromonospora TaxID=2617518 RepID=UPI0011D73E83|nr:MULTISPECIES: Tat pathway signal sequence domain protein [unclassified Micromonospora]MCW3819658.1 hypothetical protein [Micromonospora sp. DR5-3]TYC19861.1 Tat pathway signal sequence domain protein [Micromonospora sp. MP36]